MDTGHVTLPFAEPNAPTLRSGAALADAGLIGPKAISNADEVAARYAVAVPPGLAALIDPADPGDPLARQFLPDARELDTTPDELTDPIGDEAYSPVKGVTHRYPDRVLLKPVLVCPVYCRFCFRREVVGPGGETINEAEMTAAIDYIAAHPEIWEVILTGGDPLVLSDRRLAALLDRIAAIPHVQVIRIHTRVPIATPERITEALAKTLRLDKPVFVVVHCNHARELSPPVVGAIARLIDAGVPVLSQSVLLKGVNDDADTLEALFRALVRVRVRPYYLHHPDKAPGTAHFRLSIAEGRALVAALRGRLSGLCQPTYVLDIPGGHGKIPIGPDYIGAEDNTVQDYRGDPHSYE